MRRIAGLLALALATSACAFVRPHQVASARDGWFRSAWGDGRGRVWFAGDRTLSIWRTGGRTRGTVFEWTGAQWRDTDAPCGLHDIWGTDAAHVWAVGESGCVLRYDGARWSVVREGAPRERLQRVWGLSDRDIWAFGVVLRSAEPTTLALHWDGRSWTEHDVERGVAGVESVWGLRGDDLWAATGAGLAHWDGTAWRAIVADFRGGRLIWRGRDGGMYIADATGVRRWLGGGRTALLARWPNDGAGNPMGSNRVVRVGDDVWTTAESRDPSDPTPARSLVPAPRIQRVARWDGSAMSWVDLPPEAGCWLACVEPVTAIWGASAGDVWLARGGRVLRSP